MADYQMGGGYYEGETPEEYQRRMEEERRRQEALKSPVTQKIVTNADGSQEVTVKGTPEALSSANPNTPTLVQPGQPIAPDESAAETQRLQRQAQSAQGVPVAPQGFGARLGQAVSQAGTNFVNNVQNAPQNFANNLNRGMTNIQNAPDNLVRNVQNIGQPAAPATAPAPAPAVPANYNAYIAQNESGGNANIGYHDLNKGTAYGAYGITNAAYQDARKLNPALPADIRQATPEQQTAAQNAYTQQNAKYLQAYGVEPTPGNLAAAHFLGAKGLSDYLKTGTISPMAAAANGGEAKVKQIVDQRLAMGGAPASGAATDTAALTYQMPSETGRPVAPVAHLGENPAYGLPTQGGQGLRMPGVGAGQPSASAQSIERYQAIQNNPDELMKFAFDENTPDFLKQRAKDQIVEGYSQQKNLAKAEKEIGNLSAKQAADAIQGRGKAGVGDWLQYLLLKHVGLSDLANEKGEQLGIGHAWKPAMDAEGNAGMVRYTASGKPLEGVKGDGTPMDTAELNAYAAQGAGKNSDVSLTMHQALVDGKLHTFESKRTASGLLYRDATANGKWQRQAPEGMTNIGQQDPGHIKGLSAMKTTMDKMRKDNLSIEQATGKPKYSEAQIQAAGNQAYQGIAGKPFAGTAGLVAEPAEAAAPAGGSATTTTPAAPAKGPKSLAQQILDYEAPPPPPSARDAGSVALRNQVNALAAEQGKTFNSGNFKIVSTFNNSQSGKALKSINVAVDHLDTLQEAANELKNGQTPAFNKIANLYATNTGETAPGNFDALKSIVGSEVAKAVVGGASALGDREEIRKEISNAKTPEQLAGVIKKFQQLMAGQAKGIRQEWVSNGLDEAAFDAKLMPSTKVVLNQQKEPTRSKW